MPLAMEINYEDIKNENNNIPADIRKEFNKISGIELGNKISSPLKKMITNPKDLIENYDQVMECLKKNGYERYII